MSPRLLDAHATASRGVDRLALGPLTLDVEGDQLTLAAAQDGRLVRARR